MSYNAENIETLKRLVGCLFSRGWKASKWKIRHIKHKVSI